jgi:hypothetical protein
LLGLRNAFPILFFLLFAASLGLARTAAADSARSSASLQQLAGEYTNPVEPDTPLSFYVEGGKLYLESERNVPTELKQTGALLFAVEDGKTAYRFNLDGAGRAETLAVVGDASVAVLHRSGEAVHHLFHDYQRSEVMIPMRDGVKLHAVILKPADVAQPLPFLIQRTPYGVNETSRASFSAERPELARAGYIYVAEDIRGRYKSRGKFVMMRPLADHRNAGAIDESTDSYDTVAWLLKNVAGNNGRAGFIGTSYPGFLAMMAGIDPHPAVKAISPQAPMIDVWKGDDFFHNGAFRQSYGYDYVAEMESSKVFSEIDYGAGKDGKPCDGFDFFLERGSFAQEVKESGLKLLPTWKLFLDHPAYDSAWAERGVERDLAQVTVPTLTVGGYYDQEDMWGPQAEYAALERDDAQHRNFLVLGPWRHGYWSSSARHLGSLDYSEAIGKEYRAQIEARFFAFYLKDEAGFDVEDTASFQTGSNQWKRYAHFPPADAKAVPLHLGADGKLGWTAAPVPGKTSYVSDPAHPVPYRHRPIQPTYGEGSHWYNWLTEDQRFVADRKDVAVWKLATLQQDLTLTGEVMADIFAATTGTDGDLVVKLIDQYPDDAADAKMRGYQLITNAEIFRGRYLGGFDKPQPLRAGAASEFKFSLHDVDHVFKAGHTVLVQIQSSWFPLYDRNPQTFVANIMKARKSDYQAARIEIESGAGQDSTLLLPVVSGCAAERCVE